MARSVADLDLQILDLNLNILGAVTKLESSILPKTLSGCATFELWVPVTKENNELLKEDRIIWDGGDSACVIEILDKQMADDGTKMISVKGRTLEKFLLERILWGTFSFTNKNVGEIVSSLLLSNCISPTDEKRKIPLLELGNCEIKSNEKISYQKTGGTVYDAVKDLLETRNLGFEICIDVRNKKYIFNIIEGFDRTVDNGENIPVVFSSDLEDILDSNYYLNNTESRTTALVSGEALESGGTRKVIAGDTNVSGFERREIWVDARDIQSTSIDDDGKEHVLSESEINEALTIRGDVKLSECKRSEKYSATVRSFGLINYEYRKDYNLGDWITIIDNELDVEINAQITGVEETYDTKYEFTVTFGYDALSLAEKINKSRNG